MTKNTRNILIVITILITIFALGFAFYSDKLYQENSIQENKTSETILNDSSTQVSETEQKPIFEDSEYHVESVTDGDTIKIKYNGKTTPLRIIGIDAPETYNAKDATTKCKGDNSTKYLQNLIGGKNVKIAKDPTQSERDIYDRLLRYVYIDNQDVGLLLIQQGLASEYTFKNNKYLHQESYKNAESIAKSNKIGNWAAGVCEDAKANSQTSNSSSNSSSSSNSNSKPTTSNSSSNSNKTNSSSCNIKGNINNGRKIYHMPGQKYYNSTKIDTSNGERWFCSEAEAQAAGWRKAKV